MPFRRTSIRATKATGFYSPKRSRVVGSRVVGYDSDALVYINAVEAADGQALEGSVKDAYNTFVVGCKSDGIWNSIKASCIMAGARTLSGALVPLVGPSPSGFNLASGTYSRVTGLKGDGAAMYLDSRFSYNATSPSNRHASVYVTNRPGGGTQAFLANTAISPARYIAIRTAVNPAIYEYVMTGQVLVAGASGSFTGFLGTLRSSATSTISYRENAVTSTGSSTYISTTTTQTDYVFADNFNGPRFYTDARMSFYSIGESLNLALLDARVSGLMVAISGAIS